LSVFSEKNIAGAMARLPKMASKDVTALLARAKSNSLRALEAACEAELARRPFAFTAADAASFEVMANDVRDMDLPAAIRHAFTKVRPADAEEARILAWIAAHPGASFQDILKVHRKGDLGLVIGHLVYFRYGCFRQFIREGEDDSSVLLTKDRTGKSVCYTLQPEAVEVFHEIGLIE